MVADVKLKVDKISVFTAVPSAAEVTVVRVYLFLISNSLLSFDSLKNDFSIWRPPFRKDKDKSYDE